MSEQKNDYIKITSLWQQLDEWKKPMHLSPFDSRQAWEAWKTLDDKYFEAMKAYKEKYGTYSAPEGI